MFDLGGSKGRQQSGHGRSSGLSMGLAPPADKRFCISWWALGSLWSVSGKYIYT